MASEKWFPLAIAVLVVVVAAFLSLTGRWLPTPKRIEENRRLAIAIWSLLLVAGVALATTKTVFDQAGQRADAAKAAPRGTDSSSPSTASSSSSSSLAVTTTTVAHSVARVANRAELHMGAFQGEGGGICVFGILDGGVLTSARLALWETAPSTPAEYTTPNTSALFGLLGGKALS